MMNNSGTEIEQWLIEGTLETDQELGSEVWVANFDVERQVVLSQFGPYNKVFLRPEKFVKRFYHTLYPLLIEDWQINEEVPLFDGFCTINTQLDIRFQATFAYAQSQLEILSEINEYIKNTYYATILNLINNELLKLQDDSWVRSGLGDIERCITLAVNEMLMLENIQPQAVCAVKASFAEFPDVQIGKENIYLNVLKKSYEVTEENKEELFRQQQEEQHQQWEHKKKQLENFAKDAELERIRQAQDAKHQKQLLLDQEQQLKEQLEIQARLHMEKLQYDKHLKEIALKVDLQQKQQQENQMRVAEQKSQAEELAHQVLLKEQEVQADIEKYEQKQVRWLAAKANKNELQLQHEYRQEQIRFNMRTANKKRLEEEQMEVQEQNYKI
ncbi:MAG: hypothetical protein GQ529_05145, partial [Methyloprofundus sp.]|nr:hypothetical protein [Methyloprofundus sp.]